MHDTGFGQLILANRLSSTNLWHGSQICGTATKYVAGPPYLWQDGHICGRMAKSVVGWPNLCHSGHISVAQRPYLWHSSQICGILETFCGIAAKSVASRPNLWPQQPNLWHSSLICIRNRKFVYEIVNLCTKEENIRMYFPFLVLRRQSKNWIVITKMYKLCTLKCVLHIHYFLSGLAQFFIFFWTGFAKEFTTKIFYVKNL